MDAMEELDAGLDILTGSNPALQPDCHILGKGVLPGIRYRHLGKSGLKVDKSGFLFPSFFVFSFVDRGWPAFLFLLGKYLRTFIGVSLFLILQKYEKLQSQALLIKPP